MRSGLATRSVVVLLLAVVALACADGGAPQPSAELREVTLLYTNDFESAYDPIPAFWRDDLEHVGGVAELATLIDQVRASSELSFLLDAGDIFTGTLAKLTRGELPFELMITMGYDAMCIGNHEFAELLEARFASGDVVSAPAGGRLVPTR